MIPPGAIDDTPTRVMLAVLTETPTTLDDLAARLGATRGRVYWHLGRLRRLGLVDWVPNRHGTIHATVRPVRFGPA